MRRTSIFLEEKSWRKAEFTSAAQVKNEGVPKRPAVWGGMAGERSLEYKDSARLEELRHTALWTDDEN